MKIPEYIQKLINEKIVHFATLSNDKIPNVVPVGGISVINDERLLIVDVYFNNTYSNLKKNKQVAISVEDLSGNPRGYQIKGKATVFTSGKYFEEAKRIFSKILKKRKKFKADKVKSAVLGKVDEIFPTVSPRGKIKEE